MQKANKISGDRTPITNALAMPKCYSQVQPYGPPACFQVNLVIYVLAPHQSQNPQLWCAHWQPFHPSYGEGQKGGHYHCQGGPLHWGQSQDHWKYAIWLGFHPPVFQDGWAAGYLTITGGGGARQRGHWLLLQRGGVSHIYPPQTRHVQVTLSKLLGSVTTPSPTSTTWQSCPGRWNSICRWAQHSALSMPASAYLVAPGSSLSPKKSSMLCKHGVIKSAASSLTQPQASSTRPSCRTIGDASWGLHIIKLGRESELGRRSSMMMCSTLYTQVWRRGSCLVEVWPISKALSGTSNLPTSPMPNLSPWPTLTKTTQCALTHPTCTIQQKVGEEMYDTCTAGILLYRDCLYRNLCVMPIYDIQNCV